MTHGRNSYERHGCRCVICRAGNAVKVAATRARRMARLADSTPEGDDGHGTTGGYDSGCRCEACSLTRQSRYWREEGTRRHYWRELVTETFRSARAAWEALRESGTPAPTSAPGVAHSGVAMLQLEDEDFRRAFPAPTLRSVLEGLAA